jgi:TRAP-type C4-dicarboxylate transport system permease small subunit
LKVTDGINRFERFTHWLSSWFEQIAIIGFLGMMVGTLIDVIGSKAFHWPLPASLEVVFFCQLIAISGALAYGEIDRRHIRVEFIVDRFPRKVRAFFHGFSAALGLAFFVILTWKAYQYAMTLKDINEVTATSRIILYPFVLWLGLSLVPLCLVLIGEILEAISEGMNQ